MRRAREIISARIFDCYFYFVDSCSSCTHMTYLRHRVRALSDCNHTGRDGSLVFEVESGEARRK